MNISDELVEENQQYVTILKHVFNCVKVKNLSNECFPYMFENQNINDIDVHKTYI